jgi:hypothetical protein
LDQSRRREAGGLAPVDEVFQGLLTSRGDA